MGIFSNILNKISITEPKKAPSPQAPNTAPAAPQSAPSPSAASAPVAAKEPVDVEAVLSAMAAEKGGGGNWRTSIVDLLKMLDLDSSLQARKELGQELNVHAGADGSAEQNIALQKAVWTKLAENGGRVPASLKD